MCGIAGIAVPEGRSRPTAGQLQAMCATLVHRGPDDEGTEIAGGVALGMRRLSIIDVVGGHQPISNEDGSVRMVFNGEIYNYRELRAGLEARGHRFRTHSDGEVIVHLWEEQGPDFVRCLNGMFAIAVHDIPRGRLVLARDRLGIKPLFYAHSPAGLVFGSEVKALLASGRVERRVDVDGLRDFLAWEYVPAPRTLFKGIRKLEPAHVLEFDVRTGGMTCQRYWDVPLPRNEGRHGEVPAEEWAATIDGKIGECVRRQLVSDVPLGAFLSGGVDSSLVVAHMGPVSTFSIGFDDPSYNELEWSGRVARHLGVRHVTEVITPQAVDLFDRLMHYMDDPIADVSIFPTYLVSRLARREVTVALSGDGGDEVFGGYETYVAQRAARAWSRLPLEGARKRIERNVLRLRPRVAKKGVVNKARRFVEGLEHHPALEHARWRLFTGEALERELFTEDACRAMSGSTADHVRRLFDRAGDRAALDRELFVDLNSYLVDNCLVKVDRMSMACSLEVRVPLLDHELVELAFSVPAGLKLRGRTTKALLKRVAARHVPSACVYRPKEGFSIPMKRWLATDFRPLLEELLDSKRLAAEGLFRVPTVERLKREHLEGLANHSHVLWAMMVFQDWRRRWAA